MIEPTPPGPVSPPDLDRVLDTIVARLSESPPDADGSIIRRACAVLREIGAQDGMLVHDAIDTAEVLVKLRLDPPAVARLVVEQRIDRERLRARLEPALVSMLDGVQRLAPIRWDRLEEEAAESLRKMIVGMAQDVRVVMGVLAMGVQRIRSLLDAPMSADERRRYARATLEVSAPSRTGSASGRSSGSSRTARCARSSTRPTTRSPG